MRSGVKKFIAAGALLSTVTITGAFAYLTSTDQQTNTFTVGEVKIELKEEKWDKLKRSDDTNKDGKVDANDIPDEAKHMYPTQSILKDPKVVNQGKNAAWVYLQVEVPKENVITADSEGNRLNGGNPAPTQLYDYKVNGIENAGDWSFLASDLSAPESNVYLYATKKSVAPGEQTDTLFDSVTFANLVEGQIAPGKEEGICVTAYAIQEGNAGDSAEAWNRYANQAAGDAKKSIRIPSVKK